MKLDTRRALGWTIGLVLTLYGPMIAIHALCIAGYGWAIPGVEMFVFIPLLAAIGFVTSLASSAVPKTRQDALFGAVVTGGLCVGFPFALWLSATLRSVGFARAARRAEPVVKAVEAYTQGHGRPPANLQDVVPGYLPALPDRLPPLQIVTGDVARLHYGGNEWALTAFVASGIINFDQFLYYPNQAYPRTAHSGWLERIDRWAYVHE